MSRQNNQQPYFPHDANSRNKDRVIRLRMQHGVAGYGVYMMLMERLRDEDEFEADLDYEILAWDFDCDVELIRSVIIDFGLFVVTDEGRRFHSVELTEKMSYMLEAKQRRVEAARKAAECRWGKRSCEPSTTKGDEIETVNEVEQQPELPLDYGDRLQNEIDTLKNDEKWTEAIMEDLKIDRDALESFIDSFRVVCVGNGFPEGHPTIRDAKCHCRNYINKMKNVGRNEKRNTGNSYRSQVKSDVESKKRREEYENMLKKSQSGDNVFRNKGYDPADCTRQQLYDAEWLSKNPPTHPEWIGRFPGRETVEMVMNALKMEEALI